MDCLAVPTAYDIFYFSGMPARSLNELMTYTADELHDRSVSHDIHDIIASRTSRLITFQTANVDFCHPFEDVRLLFDNVPKSFNTRIEELRCAVIYDSDQKEGIDRYEAFNVIGNILDFPFQAEYNPQHRWSKSHVQSQGSLASLRWQSCQLRPLRVPGASK
jgi:hypothetical protein